MRYLGTDKQVRYWCQDENRLGLKTLTGRTITLKGVKPLGLVGWQRKNFYLYGVVEPATGDSFFLGVFSPRWYMFSGLVRPFFKNVS